MRNKIIIPVNCVGCGSEILISKSVSNDRKTFFCSPICYDTFYTDYCGASKLAYPFKNCLYCNQEFNFVNEGSSKSRSFCSLKCFGRYRAEVINVAKPKITAKISKICRHCKKEYYVWPYRINSEFCSVKCHDNIRREILNCLHCGIEFTAPAFEKRKYCSLNCASYKIYQESSGELAIKEFLDSNNIKYLSQGVIMFDNGYCKPDIIVGNKIIEYYGEYWHCSDRLFDDNQRNHSIKMIAQQKRKIDEIKIENLRERGYETLIVWEHDWMSNREITKQNILSFLDEHI